MAYGITYTPQATDFNEKDETSRNLRNIIDIFKKSEHNVKRLEWVEPLMSSELHNTYSINAKPADPHIFALYGTNVPAPSKLDLQGKNPSYEYKKNLPPGARV